MKIELTSLKERKFEEPHNFRLLTISLRNIADNAENNNRYEEASNFRKSAFECERLERKSKQSDWFNDGILCWNVLFKLPEKAKSFPSGTIHSLYRILSDYGEKWERAFKWLFAIWFGFAILYWMTQGFKEYLTLLNSLGYSLQVMILQKPDPRPQEWWTMLFYGLQSIFAPVQAALLALAIRRKFLR